MANVRFSKRLAKELSDLSKAPPEGWSCFCRKKEVGQFGVGQYICLESSACDDVCFALVRHSFVFIRYNAFSLGVCVKEGNNLDKWVLTLKGAPGTLYENESFDLQLRFSPQYPMESPEGTSKQ
jgi:ubiquitin-protein ligase